MINQALIIAAGFGSRLKRNEADIPKPLRTVAGLTLLKRILLTAKQAGITEFVIVVGHQKEKIIEAVDERELGVKITFVTNPEWEKSNGVSVLCAKPYLQKDFALLMSDHIFEAQTLKAFCDSGLNGLKARLAIDKKLGTIFDMDDATKVLVDGDRIVQISKSLTDYNAVDTGMFLASPDLFTALEAAKKDGNCSLSDGIQALCAQNQMGTFDIGGAFWQDVDTAPTLRYAEKYLLNSCRKPTDGFISRNFNRHISLFLTRYLLKTPLSANHLTAIVSVIGIFSGVFVAQGDYWNGVIGGFLFKLVSILDGCDGEMARLKMTQSKVGQWLDTLSDNSTYLAFLIGVIVGVSRQGNPYMGILAPLTLFGLCMTLAVMFFYLIRHTNSGSLVSVHTDLKKNAEPGLLKKIFLSLRFAVRRDFFATLFFFMALLGKIDWILGCFLVGTNVVWIVLLKTLFASRAERVPSQKTA